MRRMRVFALTFASALVIAMGSALLPTVAQQADIVAIDKRVRELHAAGDYAGALVEAQKLESAVKARVGTEHRDYADAIIWLGMMHASLGRYADADALYQRALSIYEKALGKIHLDVANPLNGLAYVHVLQGKYADAEVLYKRALAILEKGKGTSHPDVAHPLIGLANVYQLQGRYADAEGLYKRTLAIRENALGTNHPEVALTLNYLADVYETQGKYDDAERHFQRALAIREKERGADHPDVANSLIGLASAYRAQGKYADAEGLYQRALAIKEKALGANHPEVARTLHELAMVYQAQGKYAEAEGLYKRTLATDQRTKDENHPDVALTLNNLANVYRAQGKHADAEGLHKRALAIKERALGANHAEVATTLNNLAVVYREQGKYTDAERLYQRALAIYEKALGANHPNVATTLTNLAVVCLAQGKCTEAEGLYQRALAIREKARGANHPHVAGTLNYLAALYTDQGKYAEAEGLYRRSLAIREKALGANHPDVALTLNNLAILYGAAGDSEKALVYSRMASRAVIAHAGTEAPGAAKKEKAGGLVEQRTDYFHRHVAYLELAARQRPELAGALTREGFEIAQWATQSSAAAALAQMAARQAKGGGALAALVRERQDRARQWQAVDQHLNTALARGDGKRAEESRGELSRLDAKLAEIDARLAREFPDYAVLSNPKPLSMIATQALLGADEALILVLETPELGQPFGAQTFAWLVTKNDFRWLKLPLAPRIIAEKVQALRCGLDYTGEWGSEERRQRCLRLVSVKTPPATEDDPLPFDLQMAHELYETLFGAFKDAIRDKQLLIVPTGALTTLPFHVLVTDKPERALPVDGDYRGVAWFGQRHAVAVLPSVTSLKALRQHAGRASAAPKPFIGFGNPLLTGRDGTDRRAERKQTCRDSSSDLSQKVTSRSVLDGNAVGLLRSGRGNVALLRQQEPLPETADELCAVGQSFAATSNAVFLGARATERTVKSLSANGTLASYRVLHFATHGLLPSETEKVSGGNSEAALLLTPPDKASDEDDGLLTASEVTELKLNADWVIMSACNTGSGDKPGGEALSGLARAFFYAGARALLVSHWYVDSHSAVALTTKAFAEMQRDPKIGRAEALRRSMRALVDSGGRWAHPANWAPFVLVGEGTAP